MSGASQQQTTNNSLITVLLYRTVLASPAGSVCDTISVGNRVQGNQDSEIIMFLNSSTAIKAQGYNMYRMNYSIMCFSKSYTESMALADYIVSDVTNPDVSQVSDYFPAVDSAETVYTDQDDYVTTINVQLKVIET